MVGDGWWETGGEVLLLAAADGGEFGESVEGEIEWKRIELLHGFTSFANPEAYTPSVPSPSADAEVSEKCNCC